MSEYAPAAIRGLFDRITLPSKVLSGIVGDQDHDYGYHRGRDYLPAGDYSTVYNLDQQGSGQAAAGLDVSLSPPDMATATSRLLEAARAGDPRLAALREFGGTLDGTTTKAYDLATDYESDGEWDDTHLWHIHCSLWRAYADAPDMLNPIADVINGVPAGAAAPPAGALEDDGGFDDMIRIDHGNAYLLTNGKILRISGPSNINGPIPTDPDEIWRPNDAQWDLLVRTYGQPAS